ncbi:MAG: hypothetical protein JWQ38_2258 [Flavipsychrobacter sp.]|nr:hypothetical protein [Flavipsychrobacter sp.]
MVKKLLVLTAFVFMLFTGNRAFSQDIAPQNLERLQIMEDSLLVSADSMYDAFIPDTRIGYSERFVKQMIRALKIPNSYYYPFEKLNKKINIISADDHAFRILNWEITPSSVQKRYYGAVQMPSERLKLWGLLDYADQMGKGAEDSILTNRKWFGAIIYRIISHEVEGRTVYTLFGMNTSNPLSNKKVLDPMIITDAGVTFGAPIFGVASENFPRQRINRFILEYKKAVQVSMNWNEERKMIVFDKLVSQGNDPHRKYTFVPSGQYDGFKWGNDTWNYQTDIIPLTILKDGEAPSDQPK